MNAADVLRDVYLFVDDEADLLVAALLAHGGQGVAILPDGGTWKVLPWGDPPPQGVPVWLVPVSAEDL